MIDQLIIGGKFSFNDFGASIASRKIGQPAKKEIKETVPFSNRTYDFSAINGEIYWEERELEYVFEMIAPTPEELEEMKIAFSNWIMNIFQADIYDPFIRDYHFTQCTYSNIEYEDEDNVEKTTATVTFTAYPYKVANAPTQYSRTVSAGATLDLNVSNNSSHRITPTFTVEGGSVLVGYGGGSFTVPEGVTTDETFKLAEKVNQLTLQNTNEADITVMISFSCEVF